MTASPRPLSGPCAPDGRARSSAVHVRRAGAVPVCKPRLPGTHRVSRPPGARRRRRGFHLDPKARADELELARSDGKGVRLPLAIRSGTGARLEMRDSLVSVGDSFFGVFFDVTDLMADQGRPADRRRCSTTGSSTAAKTLQRTQGAAIRTLARLAEYRDPETGSHLLRICEYTRLLAIAGPLRRRRIHSASPRSTATRSPPPACCTTSGRCISRTASC